ncbi:hypothetical protein LP419_16850 [Massilia sp. H-1]|nr:hypothetical protein LP419_16850 [Massilia sp. H-1]
MPPAIKEEIRMTGDVVGTKSYRRAQGGPGEGVPPELRALLQALSSDAALPALWSRTAHDWIRSRIASDEERLEAQRAVQDVADGCVACLARYCGPGCAAPSARRRSCCRQSRKRKRPSRAPGAVEASHDGADPGHAAGRRQR